MPLIYDKKPTEKIPRSEQDEERRYPIRNRYKPLEYWKADRVVYRRRRPGSRASLLSFSLVVAFFSYLLFSLFFYFVPFVFLLLFCFYFLIISLFFILSLA